MESIVFHANVVYPTLAKQNVNYFFLNEHKLNIRNHETNKSALAKQSWVNDQTFNFHSAKIICKPTSVFEFDFLEVFHIHKKYNNVVNCDFVIPPLSDCCKSFIKSFIRLDHFSWFFKHFLRLLKHLSILISHWPIAYLLSLPLDPLKKP